METTWTQHKEIVERIRAKITPIGDRRDAVVQLLAAWDEALAQLARMDAQLGQACDDWDARQRRREQRERQPQYGTHSLVKRDVVNQITRALDAGDLHQAKRIAGMLGWH